MATEQSNTKEQEALSTINEAENLNSNKPANLPVPNVETAANDKIVEKPEVPVEKKKAESKPGKKSASKKAKQNTVGTKQRENLPVAVKKTKLKTNKKTAGKTTRFIFQLKFYTKPGESIFITGNHEIFGNEIIAGALPMQYLNEDEWAVLVDIDASTILPEGITYNYVLKNQQNFTVYDWGSDKKLTADLFKYKEVLIADSWNFAGYYSNAFYTEPFQNVLLKNNFTEVKTRQPKNFTHIFRIKAPLLKKGETVCLLVARCAGSGIIGR